MLPNGYINPNTPIVSKPGGFKLFFNVDAFTADRTIAFQDQSGTIALLDVTGGQIFTGLHTFANTPAFPSGLSDGSNVYSLPLGDGALALANNSALSGYAVLAGANTFTAQNTFAGGTITTSKPFSITQTWNAAGVTFSGLELSVTNTASAVASTLFKLAVGGTVRSQVDRDGRSSWTSTALHDGTLAANNADAFGHIWYTDRSGVSTQTMRLYRGRLFMTPILGTPTYNVNLPGAADGAGDGMGQAIGSGHVGFWAGHAVRFVINTTEVRVLSTQPLTFGDMASGAANVSLWGDTANVLGLRNGTTPQNFHVYNTYTDASNYQRIQVGYDAGQAYLRTQNAGTGVAQNLNITSTQHMQITAGGALWFASGTVNHWVIDGNYYIGMGHLLPITTTNTLDVGNPSHLVRSGYFGTSLHNAGFYEGTEMVAPAAPAANKGRLFFQDNGAGKTQLMVLFQSGVAQQIAIEP